MLPVLLMAPGYLDLLVLTGSLISFTLFIWLIYLIFIKPVLKVLADLTAQPPETGFIYEIIVDDTNRNKIISVGQLDADIKTRMKGIKEDHLRLRFKKEAGQEDYNITVIPGGPLFYKAPHAARLEPISAPESFESSEMIGYPAVFRIAANVSGGRALQYIEMELSNYFSKDAYGKEQMRFVMKLIRYYPGVLRTKPVKKGIYAFGKDSGESGTDENTEDS